jgi:hypothetical protein
MSAAPELKAPGLSAPGAALLALLLALASVAFLWRVGVLVPGAAEPDFSLPPWQPPAPVLARLAAGWPKRLAALPPAEDAEVRALEDAYRGMNRAEITATELRTPRETFEQAAKGFVGARGPEAYLAIGARLADELVAALEQGDEQAQARLGGSFARDAQTVGMLPTSHPAGRAFDPPTRWVVRTAFLVRWIGGLGEPKAVQRLLSADERGLFLAWKVVAHRGIDLGRRAELARELERLGGEYPAYRALGAWAADARLWPEAAGLYRRALARDPEDPVLKATVERATQLAHQAQ